MVSGYKRLSNLCDALRIEACQKNRRFYLGGSHRGCIVDSVEAFSADGKRSSAVSVYAGDIGTHLG